MDPQNLPRFTLLHGPFQSCINFGTELMSRSSNIVNIDFEEPVIDGILATMYNGDVMSFNPNDFSFRQSYIPDTQTPFHYWTHQQKTHMREQFGDDILGRIFMSEYRDADWDYSHILMRDFDHPPDIKPILTRFSQSDLCIVNLGPLTNNFMLNCGVKRCFWVATTAPKDQVDNFLKELQQGPTPWQQPLKQGT